jgi:hypothetical protein
MTQSAPTLAEGGSHEAHVPMGSGGGERVRLEVWLK